MWLPANKHASTTFSFGDDTIKRDTPKGPIDAISQYDEAIAREPRYVTARLARASLLIDSGRTGEALDDIAYVRGRFPGNARAAYLNAVAAAHTGDQEAASASLDEEAAAIIAGMKHADIVGDPQTLLLAGAVSFFRGDDEDALSYLRRYVRNHPRHPGARQMLSSLLLRLNYPRQAADVLEPALEMSPDDPQLLSTLATAFMQDNRYADATALFEKAVSLAPGRSELRSQRALLSLLRGRPANAIADLETAIELDPEATRAATMLALTEMRLGNYQSALRAATVLLDRGEDNPFAHNLAGGAHLGLGDIAAGRAAFERALAIDPDYWPAVDNLANLDMAAGDIEAAQRRYVEALERDDMLIGAMIALAKLADAAGESAEAIRWLERRAAPIEASPTSWLRSSRSTARPVNLRKRCRLPRRCASVTRQASSFWKPWGGHRWPWARPHKRSIPWVAWSRWLLRSARQNGCSTSHAFSWRLPTPKAPRTPCPRRWTSIATTFPLSLVWWSWSRLGVGSSRRSNGHGGSGSRTRRKSAPWTHCSAMY